MKGQANWEKHLNHEQKQEEGTGKHTVVPWMHFKTLGNVSIYVSQH